MDASPPLDTASRTCSIEKKGFSELVPYHWLYEALWTAGSSKYEPEILNYDNFEFTRVDLVLCMHLVGSQGGAR